MKDHLSYIGAWLLAKDIENYWAGRGHSVHVWVVKRKWTFHSKPTGQQDRSGKPRYIYDVRSDLVNGLPRLMMILEQADD